MHPHTEHALDRLNAAVQETIGLVVSDTDMPDVVGGVHACLTRLKNFKQELLQEAVPQDGRDWRLVEGRLAKRSYNSDAIFSDVMDATEMPLLDVVRMLLNERAVKLQFNWTELRRLLSKLGVMLRVEQQEIGDGDAAGAHVGEVWRTSVRVEHKDTYL